MSTHPDRRPTIRPSRRGVVIAEHRGRLLELTELRTLAEMMREDGRSFAEALHDRERAMIRETHVRAPQTRFLEVPGFWRCQAVRHGRRSEWTENNPVFEVPGAIMLTVARKRGISVARNAVFGDDPPKTGLSQPSR